jgi:hypothetical protein
MVSHARRRLGFSMPDATALAADEQTWDSGYGLPRMALKQN